MVKRLNIPNGTRFGKMVVVKEVDHSIMGNRKRKTRCFLMLCDCGKEKYITIDSLRSGRSNSCGCERIKGLIERTKTHGWSYHKIYYSWYDMVSRCHNDSDTGYYLYGAKGISVCDRWRISVENFIEDMFDSWYEGATIERLDFNGNYTPENCEWVTKHQQCKNQGLRNDNSTGFKGVSKVNSHRCPHYMASWLDLDGKQCNKSFSISKYGEDEARMLAIEYRIKQMLLLNQQGAGYSESHIYGNNNRERPYLPLE